MNKLFQNLTTKEVVLELLPSFAVSLLVAEMYYKLGSFTLECIAFLGTWYAIGMFLNTINSLSKGNK